MSRDNVIPTEVTIKRKFEELALFWSFTPATGDKPATSFRAGKIDGEFEATYNIFNQQWHITDVWVEVDNGKLGSECRWHAQNLDADTDERFYFLVLDALENQYGRSIEDWLDEELAQHGLQAA
jgi:hypothetical protein